MKKAVPPFRAFILGALASSGFCVGASFAEARIDRRIASASKLRPVNPAPPISDGGEADAASERGRLAGRLRVAVASGRFGAGELGLWAGMNSGTGLEPIFAQNPSKPMIPASLSKLVTAAAALRILGPARKFKTQIAAASEPTGSTLNGPIYLVGGGDPSFVSENMWALVNEFTRAGILQIEGDVIVDDSRFDAERFDEDREDVRVDRAYDAPIGAMSMNWNSVNVYVRPGAAPGAPARVTADPASAYLRVRNQATTGGAGKSISVERRNEPGFSGDVIVVSGKIAAGHEELVVYKNITKPDLWSGHQLVEFLKQRGVSVKGQVRAGAAPAGARTLAFVESKPLAGIVADMSKWSNNYVAEMLAKNVAAEAGQRPATMKSGLAEINRYLGELGFKDFVFINASGFTRGNRFAPEQLGRFLEAVRADFPIFPEFLASLPVAGVDGTLRSRMKSGPGVGSVRAKTGLLNGAVGLAGYAGRPSGRIVSFVFIYNGGGREDRARALFDQMAGILAEEL